MKAKDYGSLKLECLADLKERTQVTQAGPLLERLASFLRSNVLQQRVENSRASQVYCVIEQIQKQ